MRPWEEIIFDWGGLEKEAAPRFVKDMQDAIQALRLKKGGKPVSKRLRKTLSRVRRGVPGVSEDSLENVLQDKMTNLANQFEVQAIGKIDNIPAMSRSRKALADKVRDSISAGEMKFNLKNKINQREGLESSLVDIYGDLRTARKAAKSGDQRAQQIFQVVDDRIHEANADWKKVRSDKRYLKKILRGRNRERVPSRLEVVREKIKRIEGSDSPRIGRGDARAASPHFHFRGRAELEQGIKYDKGITPTLPANASTAKVKSFIGTYIKDKKSRKDLLRAVNSGGSDSSLRQVINARAAGLEGVGETDYRKLLASGKSHKDAFMIARLPSWNPNRKIELEKISAKKKPQYDKG